MSLSLSFALGSMAVLMLLGIPIWAAIIGACIPYLLVNGVPLVAITSIMAGGNITSYIILAFPLFALAGTLMNSGSVTNRLFDFSNITVGWVKGGLGHVNVLASMLFAGMSGSAIADISGLGKIEIKGMTDNGYDLEFSCGITLASSVLGPIIPPSTAAIIYCVIAGESVLKLFLGGFLPGILIAATLMIMVYIVAKNRNYATITRPTFMEWLRGWKPVFLSLLTPIILIMGMIGGIFTPTEAASIAVAYSIFLGTAVYKSLSLKQVLRDITGTAVFCAGIYAIIAASSLLSFVFTRENVGHKLVAFVLGLSMPPTAVILMILLIVLILGCFIDGTALMILLLPIVMPIITAIGYPVVAFGIIFILTTVMGILTPPFGLGLYIGAEITGLSFQATVKSVLPFLIPLCVSIVIMVYFPGIVTVIPSLLVK